jgi:hypothetical protein
MTDYPDVPNLDEARQRLVRRFGDGVQSWMDELPGHLLVLRERWGLELDSVLPKGGSSANLVNSTLAPQRVVGSSCRRRNALCRWTGFHQIRG